MNALFNRAARQLGQLAQDVDRLLASEGGSTDMTACQGQIAATLTTLQKTLGDLQEFVRREISMERREQSLARLKGMQGEYARLRDGLEAFKVRRREADRQRVRDELGLTHRPPTSNGVLTAEHYQRREELSVQYTGSRVDEMIAMGSGALDGLRHQHGLMKGTHRRLLDGATTLGVSRSLMRIIERRTAQDRIVFYVGVAVTVLVIYVCYRYFL